MKKILVLSGSSMKNGMGIKLVNEFKQNFDEKKYSFKIIYLSDYNIKFCKGCKLCFKTKDGVCQHRDDVEILVKEMEETDGIIFTSPVYGINVSGQIKTFIDRISYLYHKPNPKLIAKPTLCISSADIGGISLISKYMAYIINAMGLREVSTIGALPGKYKKDEIYRRKINNKLEEISKKLKKELHRKELPKPKFKELFHFYKWQSKHSLSKNIYRGDYEYWLERGWFDSNYYYDTEINIFNKSVFKLIKKIIKKKLKNSI